MKKKKPLFVFRQVNLSFSFVAWMKRKVLAGKGWCLCTKCYRIHKDWDEAKGHIIPRKASETVYEHVRKYGRHPGFLVSMANPGGRTKLPAPHLPHEASAPAASQVSGASPAGLEPAASPPARQGPPARATAVQPDHDLAHDHVAFAPASQPGWVGSGLHWAESMAPEAQAEGVSLAVSLDRGGACDVSTGSAVAQRDSASNGVGEACSLQQQGQGGFAADETIPQPPEYIGADLHLDAMSQEEEPGFLEGHAAGQREAPEGVDSAHLEELRQRQPGEDGGKRSWRVESVPYGFKDNGLDPAVLKEFLLSLLSIKCSGQGCSQATITALLQVLKGATLLIPKMLRDNLPDDFKGLYSTLHALGLPRLAAWVYDKCPCGILYR